MKTCGAKEKEKKNIRLYPSRDAAFLCGRVVACGLLTPMKDMYIKHSYPINLSRTPCVLMPVKFG